MIQVWSSGKQTLKSFIWTPAFLVGNNYSANLPSAKLISVILVLNISHFLIDTQKSVHYTASLGSKWTIWQCVLEQLCDVLIWISSYNQLTWIDIAHTVQLEMMFTVERTPWALPLKPLQVLFFMFLHRCNKNMQTEIAVSPPADKTHIRSSRCHFSPVL